MVEQFFFQFSYKRDSDDEVVACYLELYDGEVEHINSYVSFIKLIKGRVVGSIMDF